MTSSSLGRGGLVVGTLLLLGGCGEEHASATFEGCAGGINRLQVALQAGGEAAAAPADRRSRAEDELNEATEARDREKWSDCIEALEEAFEAVNIKVTF